MDKGVALGLTAAVGCAIALQAPINSHLGKSVGTYQAAFFSFATGTVLLLLIASLADGGLGNLKEVKGLSWYYLVGGMLGAMYVTTVIVTVRELGTGTLVAATITGQLSMSVVIDHFGWLSTDKHPITATRIIGIVLLAAGMLLIVRE